MARHTEAQTRASKQMKVLSSSSTARNASQLVLEQDPAYAIRSQL
jgi:hypothetical protein